MGSPNYPRHTRVNVTVVYRLMMPRLAQKLCGREQAVSLITRCVHSCCRNSLWLLVKHLEMRSNVTRKLAYAVIMAQPVYSLDTIKNHGISVIKTNWIMLPLFIVRLIRNKQPSLRTHIFQDKFSYQNKRKLICCDSNPFKFA
jgi:hypothetical protein